MVLCNVDDDKKHCGKGLSVKMKDAVELRLARQGGRLQKHHEMYLRIVKVIEMRQKRQKRSVIFVDK